MRSRSTVRVYRSFDHNGAKLDKPIFQYLRSVGPPPLGGKILTKFEPPTMGDIERAVAEELSEEQREFYNALRLAHPSEFNLHVALSFVCIAMMSETERERYKAFLGVVRDLGREEGTGPATYSPWTFADVHTVDGAHAWRDT